MNILLINIDSKIPNFALAKIRKYHEQLGDAIKQDVLFSEWADKIYVSCVFDWNRAEADCWANNPKAIVGGSGYSLSIVLPPEIEQIKPRMNYGFTTRGCIRNCPFCIVPKKEGKPYIVGTLADLWDGKSKEITVMDNNILALPEHFFDIAAEAQSLRVKVDFNQGLDHRLLTPKIAKTLVGMRHKSEIRFAFDNIASKPTVERALCMLKDAGLKNWKSRWYVYIGPSDTWETVYPRMKYLQDMKQLVYVMRDRKVYANPLWIATSQWGNTPGAFKMDLKELLEKSERMKTYAEYFNGLL